MMLNLPIQTERLLLREYEETDWQAVHAYGSDPVVVRFMPWGPNTEDETREFVERVMAHQWDAQRKEFELAVTLREEGPLIGGCGLSVTDQFHRGGMLGYCFSHDFWGQGYATEAARALLRFGFKELALHRVYATCDVLNVASARVLEKIGMQREGRLREHMWIKGQWRDSFLYAILEREWSEGSGFGVQGSGRHRA
jgi:RimJ/RimL family protein N-acetyltransferase